MLSQKLQLDTALAEAKALPFAYLKHFSSLTLGKNDPSALNREELLEARFFSEDCEIRILREENGLQAYAFCKETSDMPILVESGISDKCSGLGTKVKKWHYLSEDADGQCYVSAVCLCGWEG